MVTSITLIIGVIEPLMLWCSLCRIYREEKEINKNGRDNSDTLSTFLTFDLSENEDLDYS